MAGMTYKKIEGRAKIGKKNMVCVEDLSWLERI
jgi:hypothetical protein